MRNANSQNLEIEKWRVTWIGSFSFGRSSPDAEEVGLVILYRVFIGFSHMCAGRIQKGCGLHVAWLLRTEVRGWV